jgi:hypothetical protein
MALGAEMGDGCVDVRGPQHHGVQHLAERAELVRRTVAVRLVDGAALAMAHVPGRLVPGHLHGDLGPQPQARRAPLDSTVRHPGRRPSTLRTLLSSSPGRTGRSASFDVREWLVLHQFGFEDGGEARPVTRPTPRPPTRVDSSSDPASPTARTPPRPGITCRASRRPDSRAGQPFTDPLGAAARCSSRVRASAPHRRLSCSRAIPRSRVR